MLCWHNRPQKIGTSQKRKNEKKNHRKEQPDGEKIDEESVDIDTFARSPRDSENVDQAPVNDSIQPPVRRLIKNLLFPTLKALLYHHQLEVNRLLKISGVNLIPVFDAKTVHVKIKSGVKSDAVPCATVERDTMMCTCHSASAKVKPSVKPSSGIVMKIL
ncbi:uncharacterized protein LOC117119254 isoform X2 [Anneissia japonica]|uniref:uncharacterized protein LOC117119254 isoform X2 n=1 Tax=Anneissia japonica TaxID=1529436 RepID=UPI0014257761|nr:uncharacterized protein LOC117119254 isoform X2 [Anneissia japonica]